MRKFYLILLFSFLLAGCFGEVGSGITSKECIRETNIDDVKLIEQKKIRQKDDKMLSVTVTNTIVGNQSVTFKSLKNSYLSEINNLSNLGIMTNIIDDVSGEYIVSYDLDLVSISRELKEKYQFEDLYHKQIKKYEEEGYKCE